MIQFNLLPDVKMEYIRAQRTKRTVMVVSSAVAAGSLTLFILLFIGVVVVQKAHMEHLSSDIAKYSKDLNNTADLSKILTVQNQLNSLPTIHQEKPDVKRVFPYIKQVTPAGASISSLTVDFDKGAVTIMGAADSLVTVNQFVDTLKFTQYKVDGQMQYKPGTKTPISPFKDVVLTTFGRADKGASYTINLGYEDVLFNNTKKVELIVPHKVTTRSAIEKPDALFERATKDGVTIGNGQE